MLTELPHITGSININTKYWMKLQASPSFKMKSLHAFLWGQNPNYFTEQITLALFYFLSKRVMAWVMLNEKRFFIQEWYAVIVDNRKKKSFFLHLLFFCICHILDFIHSWTIFYISQFTLKRKSIISVQQGLFSQ